MSLPKRKRFHHEVPWWVEDGAEFFVTICCAKRGGNQLCRPQVAPVLLEAARFYHERQRWFAPVFLLMPDHVHAIMSFPEREMTLQAVVRDWKRWTAKKAGVVWQVDFFEHRLRGEVESPEQKAGYIRQNPVRAGLVARAEDWLHVFIGDSGAGRAGYP